MYNLAKQLVVTGMWFLLWLWLVCNSRHTIHTRKHHFSACTLYIAGHLLAALTPCHAHSLKFSTSHFTRESVSVFIRKWCVGNKLSWLRGWASLRCPPQVLNVLDRFSKNPQISYFMKICPAGDECSMQVDRQT